MNWKFLFLALNTLSVSVVAHIDLDIMLHIGSSLECHTVLHVPTDGVAEYEANDNLVVSARMLSENMDDITFELLVQRDSQIISNPTFNIVRGTQAQLCTNGDDKEKNLSINVKHLKPGQMSPNNPLRHQMMYAPFRERYNLAVQQSFKNKNPEPSNPKKRCVFCTDIESKNDEDRLLLTRFKHNVVFLNLFPYARGHILIIPNAHVADMEELSAEARQELMNIIASIPRVFRETFEAGGTNIGINVGKIAGASKPDHIHIHALPRCGCDHKAFIQMVCETEVVQWDLNALYKELKPAFDELKKKLERNH